jgi:uncharacterized protein (TIGR02001 family)
MRTSKKGFSTLALLSAAVPALFAAAPALAQDSGPPSDITVTGGASIVSDYRFRGASFSAEDATVQGTININHSSGVYLGTWASGLEDSAAYGHTEVDLYVGYTTEVASGTNIDVGLLYYAYPNGHALTDSNYYEPYASIKTTMGPVTAKVGAAYAWKQSAIGSNDNIYVYTDLGLGIPATPVSLNAHLGYSDGSLTYGAGNYTDWSLGADLALGHGLTAGVKYIDTDLNNFSGIPATDTLYDATVLFTLGVSF